MTPSQVFGNKYARSKVGIRTELVLQHQFDFEAAEMLIERWIEKKAILPCPTFEDDGQYILKPKPIP